MSQKSGPGWVRGTGRRDCPVGYPVKGNEPSNVFYEPGDPGYPQVIPEMCFEDAEVAAKVGFTAGKNSAAAAATGGAAAGAASAAGFMRATGGRECPSGYPIKGNEPSNVYYRPEDPGYSQVVPEVCFADVAEAEKGGFTRMKVDASKKTEPVAAVRKEDAAVAGAAIAGAAAVKATDAAKGADAAKAAPTRAADSARVAAPPPPPPPPPPPAPVAESSGGGWMKWLLPLLALAALAAGIWYFTRDDDEEEVTPTAVAATVAATTDDATVETGAVADGTVAVAAGTDVAGADGTVAAAAGSAEAIASGSEGTVEAAAAAVEGTVEAIADTAAGTAPAEAAAVEASIAADMATVEANIMDSQATVAATLEAVSGDASPVASPAASPVASPVGDETIKLEAVDIAFIPTELTISAADEPVTIKMENTGAALHNFAIDSLDIDVDVNPGETVDVVIPAGTAPGTYDFYCNVPGHKEAGMVGVLVVE